MSKYLSPIEVPGLPQGEYLFQPLVKTYAGYVDVDLLQADINTFLTAVVPVPDLRYQLVDIKFQSVSKTTNVIWHSAMLFYYEVSRV